MESSLPLKNLAFLMTRGMSLAKWARLGMMRREVALYNLLALHFDKIYFFTYGGREELLYRKYLAANIQIVLKKSRMPALLYSLLLPFYQRRILKTCAFFKSNQMDGAWSAYLAKLVNRKGYFVLRTGFVWSQFLKKENLILYPLVRIAEFWLYRRCNLALVTSYADQAYLHKKYGIDNQKIKVVANYVDTALFKPIPTIQKFPNRIIYVGRLHPQKNLANLIQALAGTKIQLDLIGKGKLKNGLKRLAHQFKVKVRFRGIVPHQDLPYYLNRYRVFVLPSFYEGAPKTLLEAMACGLACIGTRIPAIQEIITHRQNGYLTAPDSKSLRQGIEYLKRNQNLRLKIGIAGRKTVQNKFDLSKIAMQELSVYRNLPCKNA